MHPFSVNWFETLPSTNAELLRRLRNNPELAGGTVLATAHQTAGRGRYDRVWQSNPGDDLACSVLVRAAVGADRIPSLSMAVGVAASLCLDAFGVETRVKWPNDVLVGERKIAGILSEFVPDIGGTERCCVVGIGINVNMPREAVAAIDRPATSLFVETGRRVGVETVLRALLEALPEWLGRWQKSGYPAFREEWEARDWGLGRRVSVGEGAKGHAGVIKGYGAFGELILEDETGRPKTVLLGDVLG